MARFVAAGEGWVCWPGGEPVEAISNPLWTLLLAATDWLGPNPWVSAKLYGAVFGAAALPLAWLWARELLGPERGAWASAVPLLLALSPQYVIWCASGLENALLGLLLTSGSVRMLHEVRTGRLALSGLLFGLAAITRPEGAMYGAVAGVWGLGGAVRSLGLRRAVVWALGFGVLAALPTAAWYAWRMHAFAWPLANTYYAKLEEIGKFKPWKWTGAGWSYLRKWALYSSYGFHLPLLIVGAIGIRGWRGQAGLILAAIVVSVCIPGLAWPRLVLPLPDEPEVMTTVRVVTLTAVAGLVPLLGLGRRGQVARGLAWTTAFAAAFFAIYSGGDWMAAFRWLFPVQVPIALLLVDTTSQLVRVARVLERPRTAKAIVVLLLAPVAITDVVGTVRFLADAETTPYQVHRRVAYVQGVQERLHLDHAVAIDVDFGAHMWWSNMELVDLAGLCDVSVAHHTWQWKFMHEYLMKERKPDLAHVHGAWARRTGILRLPGWHEYLPIEPYYGREHAHDGSHVHKRNLVDSRWPGPRRGVVGFEGNRELVGWDVPEPRLAAGERLYLEVGWRQVSPKKGSPGKTPFRVLAFLTDGTRTVVRELAIGYDWYPVEKWRPREVIIGRYALSLPEDLAPGRYDLGFVVFDAESGVAASSLPAPDPVLARGEYRVEGLVEIIAASEVPARDSAGLDRVEAHLEEGACEQAERAERAWRKPVADRQADDALRSRLARCWASLASETDRKRAAPAIQSARRWSHRDPEVVAVGKALADAWESEGDNALQAGEDDRAYGLWRDALIADPFRPWLRRRTEELRDKRLGIK